MIAGVSVVAGLAVGLTGLIFTERASRTNAAADSFDGGSRYAEAPNLAQHGPDPYACYQKTISAIQRSYARDGSQARTLTYEAIKGMLGSLNDQFSSYLDPVQWQQLVTMTEGRFGGIGAILEQAGNDIRIARPTPGGPAEKAGLHSNDLLISIDGHLVKGKSLDDLAQWLEGDLQTSVTLGIARGDKQLFLPVIRENIEPPVVAHWMEDNTDKIGHIVLTEFNRKSVSQIAAAYADLDSHGMRGLVLDLRFNPGGLLDAAVDVASIFIPENTKPQLHNNVVIIHHGDGEEEGLTLEPQQRRFNRMPLAVLVNGSSASAAEIVTGAIRDYDAGVIVGERTFGKGKVQTLFEMNHGRDGGIRLTTSLYYPPKRYDINFQRDADGNRIAGTGGILPDVAVSSSPDWHDFEDKANDNQLKSAIDYLKARLAGQSTRDAVRIALRR